VIYAAEFAVVASVGRKPAEPGCTYTGCVCVFRDKQEGFPPTVIYLNKDGQSFTQIMIQKKVTMKMYKSL